jgi:hypothetical protein
METVHIAALGAASALALVVASWLWLERRADAFRERCVDGLTLVQRHHMDELIELGARPDLPLVFHRDGQGDPVHVGVVRWPEGSISIIDAEGRDRIAMLNGGE